MTKSFFASCCFLASALFCAAAVPLIDEPVSDLTLKNGDVLHNAQAKGFNSNSVLVKYDTGARTVSYDQFPAEYRDALLAKKPLPPKETVAKPTTPAPKLASVAKKREPSSRLPEERFKGLALASTSISGPSGNLGIYNDTTESVDLDPTAVIAELDNGKLVPGRRWVQVDADGNPVSSMKGIQSLPPKTLTNLTLAFSGIPSGVSIVRIAWSQN